MTNHKKKSIVFGANGYIGKHLTDSLDKNNDVCAYDIHPEAILRGIKYIQNDVTNREAWNNLDLDCDEIYWMSGLSGIDIGFEKIDDFFNTNELALVYLLDNLRKRKLRPRIFYPSTRLVYRGSNSPLNEESPKETKTIYAINKLSAEHILSAYYNAFDIPFTILRICVPYGNRFDTNFSYGTMGLLFKQATQQNKITLWGDGSQRRTFTHIDDLCHQIITTTALPCCKCQTINSVGEDYSIKEIAEMFAKKYNVPIEYKPFPELPGKLESGSTVFNSSKYSILTGDLHLKHTIADFFSEYL